MVKVEDSVAAVNSLVEKVSTVSYNFEDSIFPPFILKKDLPDFRLVDFVYRRLVVEV